jgi:hypothetical protein
MGIIYKTLTKQHFMTRQGATLGTVHSELAKEMISAKEQISIGLPQQQQSINSDTIHLYMYRGEDN